MINIKNDNTISLHDLKLSYKDKIELKDIKKGDKISILSDSMMKTMFQNENRIKYSAKLISYFIDVDFEYLLKNIHLVKNELDKEKDKDINRRSDYVADIDGDYINIEVNNNGNLYTLERNMEYAHRLYSKKIKRNNNEITYTQIVQLNINNFYFEGNNKIVDIYYNRNDSNIALSKKIIYIQIFIPNLIRKWYNDGIKGLDEAERYLITLVLQDIDKSLEVGGGIKIMEEYIDEAQYVLDEDLLESYDKEQALIEASRDAGIEEGIEKGIEKGEKNIIINMHENGMSKEEISKMTGIEIEKVNEYIKITGN